MNEIKFRNIWKPTWDLFSKKKRNGRFHFERFFKLLGKSNRVWKIFSSNLGFAFGQKRHFSFSAEAWSPLVMKFVLALWTKWAGMGLSQKAFCANLRPNTRVLNTTGTEEQKSCIIRQNLQPTFYRNVFQKHFAELAWPGSRGADTTFLLAAPRLFWLHRWKNSH